MLLDPSLPAGRRREIDNVMKKARASPNSSTFWDKKLLEVEAKDPNRYYVFRKIRALSDSSRSQSIIGLILIPRVI